VNVLDGTYEMVASLMLIDENADDESIDDGCDETVARFEAMDRAQVEEVTFVLAGVASHLLDQLTGGREDIRDRWLLSLVEARPSS
jgi:hypothetical protein